jgi:hypothetical protein
MTPQQPKPFDPLAAADTIAQIVETVTGYRSQCEAAGFSPAAAEAMAIDFHQAFIASIFTPKGTS